MDAMRIEKKRILEQSKKDMDIRIEELEVEFMELGQRLTEMVYEDVTFEEKDTVVQSMIDIRKRVDWYENILDAMCKW